MVALLALLGAILVQDPAPAAPADEAERLRAENAALKADVERLKRDLAALTRDHADLRERVAGLEKQTVEDAGTVQRLRQVVKSFEGASMPHPSAPRPGTEETHPVVGPAVGPVQPLNVRIEYVDAKMNFVVAGAGRKLGILPGYRFEIMREVHSEGQPVSRMDKIGAGEFEKYMGSDEGMSKLKIVEGKSSDMRVGDRAVAYRKLQALPPAPIIAPAVPGLGVYSITGKTAMGANAGYVLNYGSNEGARQTDVVWIYSDGQVKAKLRLDIVQAAFSVGQVIDGTQVVPPQIGDQLYTKELRKTVTGRVRLNNDKQGILIDVGHLKDGILPGARFEVRRQGKKVGVIVVAAPDKYHSYAKAEGDLTREEVQVGDHIELIEEKK